MNANQTAPSVSFASLHILFAIALVFLLASCASPTPAMPTATSATATPAPGPQAVREQMKGIENYIVYYGTGRAADLARYDLAIVQPDTLTAEELAVLKEKGTLAVAYLSIGEAEPGRSWYNDGRVDLKWLLGKNENWGSYYVDARQEGWQQLMVALTGEFLNRGFDGVFLDTVDTVDLFPETRDGMIALIRGLRAAYPDALLVQNRGFSVVKDVAPAIDAVMFEDLSTGYDFGTEEYTLLGDEVTAQEMVELHQQTGLPILALDYAPPDSPGRAYRAVQTARRYGFIPAVSVIMLDDIPDYGLDRGGPADLRIRSVRAEGNGEQIEIVVTIENAGLSDVTQATMSLSVDGEPLTSLTRSFEVGGLFEWTVAWPNPKEAAKIEAVVDFQDATPDDNHLAYDYTTAALAVEPLLPPDQQKRRPAANGPDLNATALTAPVTIDGDLGDWLSFPCAKVNQKEQVSYGDPAGWSGPQDLSGEICYAWDKDSLYVAVRIRDDTIVQRYAGASLWKGDHVELWFDTQLQLDFDSLEASDDDYQLGISPGDFDKVEPSFFIWQPATPQERYQGVVAWIVVRTEDGYAAEARIPAQVLKGLRLEENHTIGATFEPSDTDTPGGTEQELMMSSAPQSSSQWGNPTLWNNLIFGGQPTVNATVTEQPMAETPAGARTLVALNTLPVANDPSDVTAIVGYAFDPGDVSQPIADEALEQARQTVRQAAAQGALWLDADTGITNFTYSFLNDPTLSYYPLAQAIVEQAHENGIKVFFYFSGSEVETPEYASQPRPTFEEQHPDWLQMDQNGKPMFFAPGKMQEFWLSPDEADARLTPLAPEYREAIFARAEKLAELGADGIFVDVPYFITDGNRWADFGPYSAQAFKQATGLDQPVNLSKDGKTYSIWIDWRHQVWADYFAELRQRVQKVNPHTLVIAEEYPGADPAGAIDTGLDPAALGASVDLIAHEYDYLQDEGGAVAYGPDDWQHTRDVYKQYQAFHRVNWSLCYATNPPDSKALAAISYAHQQSFWETKAPTMLDDSAGLEWRKQLLAWVRANAALFNGAQPAAEVALLYSSRSRDLTYAASVDDLALVQHELDGQGIPYAVITEQEIQRIHGFPYLILPNVRSTTPAVQAELAKYQGKLLLIDDSLSRDEWDQSDQAPPAELLNVEDALARITTIPVAIEEGEDLMVELYRQGSAVQVRLFNPNLDDEFIPEPQTITLKFVWGGGDPSATAFEFLSGAAQNLTLTQAGGVWQVQVPVDLMVTITIR